MSFFLLLKTKEDILKLVTKQLKVAIDFHSIFSHMEVNGQLSTKHFSKYLPLSSTQERNS